MNMETFKSYSIPLMDSQLTQIDFQRENASNKGLGDGRMTHFFLLLVFSNFSHLFPGLPVSQRKDSQGGIQAQNNCLQPGHKLPGEPGKKSTARAALAEGQPSSNWQQMQGNFFHGSPS